MSSVYLTAAAARTSRRAAHWHWPAPKRPFSPPPGSACGDHRLARETARDPGQVPTDRRCRGRGCRERWAATDQPADLMTSAEEAS